MSAEMDVDPLAETSEPGTPSTVRPPKDSVTTTKKRFEVKKVRSGCHLRVSQVLPLSSSSMPSLSGPGTLL
jgi:hypothetical protein